MEVLLAPDPQHQTLRLVLSHTAEVDIVVGADGAAVAGTGTAIVADVNSLMTDRIASEAGHKKVDGVVALVIGMNATATATLTRTYDPGMALETTANLHEIYCVILAIRVILATTLTATYARKSTDKVLWPPSL